MFYVLCAVVTWAVYSRKGGLLHDIERGRLRETPPPAQPSTLAQGGAA